MPASDKSISMRTSLSITIVLMGLLGLALALFTGNIYRHLAIENQRGSLQSLIALKAADLLHDLTDTSRELGLALQKENGFRHAFVARDTEAVRRVLNEQFFQYYVTARVVKLERLYTFDADLRPLTGSTAGDSRIPVNARVCPAMLDEAHLRHGADRIKVMAQLCTLENKALFSVLIPMGGLRPIGYMQIVSDPAYSLHAIEQALGMPIRLTFADKAVAFESAHWPSRRPESLLVSRHTLKTPQGGDALTVAIAKDIHDLNQKLSNTRYMVMIAASVVTWLVALVVLMFLDRTTLTPLRQLAKQARLVRKDKTHLGEQVQVRGNAEVNNLATEFNVMTKELKDLYEALEKMAFTDALTALPNRSRLHELLHYQTQLSQRNHIPFALFMMDLNRFKEVNDTLGHHAGDMLLQQVSSRLEKVLRKTDTLTRLDKESVCELDTQTVARLGGDEFAAILPGIGEHDDAAVVAKKILKELELPFMVTGHSFNVGISIGIVLCPNHGTDGQNLMRLADVAMYQAKANNSGYTFYDKDLDKHSLQRLTLEGELRQAIEENRLELYYQPQIDMNNGRVCGAEALLRWQHPSQGFVPPDRFIPIAEQTGLIQPLTAWVLNSALKQCSLWRKDGLLLPVSINLSPRNLFDSDIVDRIASALRNWGVDPECLSLELTESAVMTDPNRALQILTRLDQMGVRLSIDDFGTGYSSLLYLKKLPVDEIKIDKSFVMDMQDDRNDAVIVRSTIDLAHNMSLKVVAEGVENQPTWGTLGSLGCDIAQGFFMGRPMPSEDFEKWLKTSPWGTSSKD